MSGHCARPPSQAFETNGMARSENSRIGELTSPGPMAAKNSSSLESAAHGFLFEFPQIIMKATTAGVHPGMKTFDLNHFVLLSQCNMVLCRWHPAFVEVPQQVSGNLAADLQSLFLMTIARQGDDGSFLLSHLESAGLRPISPCRRVSSQATTI